MVTNKPTEELSNGCQFCTNTQTTAVHGWNRFRLPRAACQRKRRHLRFFSRKSGLGWTRGRPPNKLSKWWTWPNYKISTNLDMPDIQGLPFFILNATFGVAEVFSVAIILWGAIPVVEVFQKFHVILGKLAAWELGLFPTKNGSCRGVKWGYYHLRKHPYSLAGFSVVIICLCNCIVTLRPLSLEKRHPAGLFTKSHDDDWWCTSSLSFFVTWRNLMIKLLGRIENAGIRSFSLRNAKSISENSLKVTEWVSTKVTVPGNSAIVTFLGWWVHVTQIPRLSNLQLGNKKVTFESPGLWFCKENFVEKGDALDTHRFSSFPTIHSNLTNSIFGNDEKLGWTLRRQMQATYMYMYIYIFTLTLHTLKTSRVYDLTRGLSWKIEFLEKITAW